MLSRKEELLKGANDAQKEAIKSVYGRHIVLATAGAGKVDTL